MINLPKQLYKRIVGSITVPVFERCLRFLDARPWIPIFFFLLTRANTNDIMILHVLNSIQVKTGRKLIAITAWPFWPRETGKDPFFISFLKGLTPTITYVWVPVWLHRLVKSHIMLVW